MMTSSRNPKKFTEAEKDEQARACWQLSLDGHSVPVIAQTVGIGYGTALRRLARYRDAYVMPDAEHWRRVQIERHEDLVNALKPHVQPGSVEVSYIAPYLKALVQLDSYTGAALPVKTEVTVTMQDDTDAQLAELIAMSRAQEAMTIATTDPAMTIDPPVDEVQTDVQMSASENAAS